MIATPRRPLSTIAAVAAIAAVTVGLGIATRASAAPPPRYLVIGASVTRLSGGELRRAYGDTLQLEAVDGRSFIHPGSRGEPTIMEVFRANLAYLNPGDWVVIEMSHGGVDVATNRRYLTEVVRLLPDTVCLAVVAPHTYYGEQTDEYRAWNAAMQAMQAEVIAAQPCHRLIDWDLFVRRAVSRSNLPDAQRALGEPMLYDGRHPTTAGAREYASALWWATR